MMFSECALGPLLLLMEICRAFFRSYSSALHAHPVRVKVATSITLSFFGDVFAQNLEYMYKYRKKKITKTDEGEPVKEPKPWKWNKRRSLSTAIFGAVWGCTAHYWYQKLDALAFFYFPINAWKQTAFKVTLDMLLFEPFSVGLFFIGVGVMEGRKYDQIRGKISESFLPTIAVDFVVWPVITAYVFFKIPVNWQVIAFASMDFFYDSFLSIVQHNDVFRDVSIFVKKCITAPCKTCLAPDSKKCACPSSPPETSDSVPTSPSSPSATDSSTSPSVPTDPVGIALDIRDQSEHK